MGVKIPVQQGARKAKNLYGKDFRVSPAGVKHKDVLNNSELFN
jgi:hypothetical protein